MTLRVSAIVIHVVDKDSQAQKGTFSNEPGSQSSWAAQVNSGSLGHAAHRYSGLQRERWCCLQPLGLLPPPLCCSMARNPKCSHKSMVRITGTEEGQEPIDTCKWAKLRYPQTVVGYPSLERKTQLGPCQLQVTETSSNWFNKKGECIDFTYLQNPGVMMTEHCCS